MGRFGFLIVMGVLAFGSALWSWIAVVRTITETTASNWLVPSLAVSLLAVNLLLALTFARVWWHAAAVLVLAFGSALIFAPSVVVALAALVATGLSLSMWCATQESMADHVRIRIATHANAGLGRLIIALALLVSAVFYETIIQRDAASLMLSNSLRATMTGPIARMVLPAPLAEGSGPNGEVTVDDFIAQMIVQQQSEAAPDTNDISMQFLEDYASAVQDRIKGMVPIVPKGQSVQATLIPDVVKTQARTALATALDVPLSGNEPVADVFVRSLEQRIETFAQENVLPEGYKFSRALTGVVAFFLFLTINWIGSFVKIVWIWAVQLIFGGLRKAGALQIAMVPTEREELV